MLSDFSSKFVGNESKGHWTSIQHKRKTKPTSQSKSILKLDTPDMGSCRTALAVPSMFSDEEKNDCKFSLLK
jgi:hypothetical protein